jgi:Domain of unknown function (DUF4864)
MLPIPVRWLKHLVAGVIAAQALIVPLPAHPQALTPADALSVRRVVADQLDALAVDDAQRLYDTVTPAVQENFASSGDLLAMLRALYPMVYRPSKIGFAPAHALREAVVQGVEITDQDNTRWLALFILERQPDSSWRVGGYLVFDNPWLPA